MGWKVFTTVSCLVVSSATAQPAPAPPAPSAPALAPAPPQQGAWVRFTLTDGRVVDAQHVGGDDASYFIQTNGQTFALARAQVAAMQPLPPPATAYAPPPGPYAPPPPMGSSDGGTRTAKKVAGFGVFIGSYAFTAMVAAVRLDDDDDAKLGFLPVLGPVLWAATDDDKFFEDGWDWLAAFSTLCQGAGVYGMIRTAGGDDKPAAGAVSISPASGPGYGGFVVSGAF